MGRRPWAVIVAEPSNSSLVKEFDPLNGTVQPKADVDLEPWIASVDLVPLRAPLEGFFMLLKLLLKAFDAFSGCCSFTVVVVFPSLNRDT